MWKLKTFIIPILLCFINFQILFAQTSPDHIEGDLIVQIKDDHNINNLIDDLSEIVHLEVSEQLSAEFKICLLKFDYKSVDENILLQQIRMHPSVLYAQFNHILNLRGSIIPNDSLFNLQWQYVNDGSSGGTPDADVDMDLAWGITTGGKTKRGEDIVIAIIDVGFDLNHPDFSGNLWVNKNEIAGNGIDDDGNGYIDDIHGWNTYDDNPNVQGSTHGTSVAGIIGAKGNNDTGVAGINWNVKLMIIVGGGDESDAIKAYNYVYKMRKMYNETQGKKGAYIVAANTSWGLDLVWSSSAPVWCSMYDLMGQQGVLNVGATTNSDRDVDIEGDMPSTCPSDYLIIVNNTTRNDLKAASGYGKINVDLGAPGQNVFTTRGSDVNPPYVYFKGTSAACPMVTGVIGLLYAASCSDLLLLGDQAPDSLALLMKSFILKGTDPLPALNNITLSGGRLNAYKALLEVINVCEPSAEEILSVDFYATYDCLKDSVYFTNRSEVANGTIAEYLWTLGDGSSSNIIEPVHAYAAGGTYRVSLKALTFRGKSDSMIKEIEIRKYKSIYPLPADDKLMIEICKPGKYTITLYDLNGRTLLSDDLNTEDGHLIIYTHSLRPGLYVLQIKSETLFIQEKVLKI